MCEIKKFKKKTKTEAVLSFGRHIPVHIGYTMVTACFQLSLSQPAMEHIFLINSFNFFILSFVWRLIHNASVFPVLRNRLTSELWRLSLLANQAWFPVKSTVLFIYFFYLPPPTPPNKKLKGTKVAGSLRERFKELF